MKKLLFTLLCMLAILPATAADWKTSTGYRGNVETGFVFGAGDYGKTEWILQTTHGYQVVPAYLFIGAGGGIGVPTAGADPLIVSAMIYGNVRSHFTKTRLSPFVDVKMGFQWNRNDKDIVGGYNIQDGFYFSPSVGANYAINSLFSIDLSVGYTVAQAPVYWGVTPDSKREMHDIGGFTFRVGFNF